MSAVPLTVATIGKNASEEVRVVLDTFKGHNLVDMRVFAAFSAAAVKMPTKKGLSCRVEMLPDLIEGLRQAEVQARAMGWIGGAN
ncbi:PC4/YdbC family ssDNA-binding protein [Brevundimonas sp. DC300-4]|uniref:PC4/YdbC family ssDNA-binding protein n=1 Tax=Brevundimonas sp. DC300-4 TaxID=2804594 RepID=UPI003CE6C637